MNRIVGHARQLTIDHLVPKAHGGKNRYDNIVLACATCNRRKGDQHWATYFFSHSAIQRRLTISREVP